MIPTLIGAILVDLVWTVLVCMYVLRTSMSLVLLCRRGARKINTDKKIVSQLAVISRKACSFWQRV